MAVARCRERRVRRGSIYMLVLGVTMIVAAIGLSAINLGRIQFRMVTDNEEAVKAKYAARSAAEIAYFRLVNDPGWRSSHSHGSWSDDEEFGQATFSYKFEDEADATLDDSSSDPVRLYAKASAGDAVRVSSVVVGMNPVSILADESTVTVLRGYTNASGTSDDDLKDDRSWGQYFKPNLPATAVGWKVTSVELYVRRHLSGLDFDVWLYEPLSNRWPSTKIVGQVAVNSSSVSSSWGWHEFTFSGTPYLDPLQGLCLAVTTNQWNSPIEIRYRSGGVSAANSGLLGGDPDWDSFESDKALLYKVHGTYLTPSDTGSVTATTFSLSLVPGTWRREAQ